MEKQRSKLYAIVAQSVIAGMVTGFAALVAAVFAFIEGDWVGTGACFAAAAIAFGLVANAMLRN